MIINNKFLSSTEIKFVRININSQNIIPLLVHYLILIPFLPSLKETFIKRASPSQEKNSLFNLSSKRRRRRRRRKKRSKVKTQKIRIDPLDESQETRSTARNNRVVNRVSYSQKPRSGVNWRYFYLRDWPATIRHHPTSKSRIVQLPPNSVFKRGRGEGGGGPPI